MKEPQIIYASTLLMPYEEEEYYKLSFEHNDVCTELQRKSLIMPPSGGLPFVYKINVLPKNNHNEVLALSSYQKLKRK